MRIRLQIALARFRRWLYLAAAGTRRGEVAISTYTTDGKLVRLCTGERFEDENMRTWWIRP